MKPAFHIPFVPGLKTEINRSALSILNESGNTADIDCVNWPETYPDNRKTTVTAAHNGEALFLHFNCEGEGVKAVVDHDLGPVASDSCVEFFVSPDKDSARYWNFEFNAIGRKNISHRVERTFPHRFTQEELKEILIFPSAGTEPFEEKPGHQVWSLTVIIPLMSLGLKYTGKPIEMKGNFYKCAGKTSSPHYLSWAPIKTDGPDFHRPEFFAPLILD